MANSNEGRHTIHGLFTAMASCHPNAAAIEFESSVAVSYHDLSRQSDRLAAVLAPIIEHGQLVPVLLPRCPLQITVILALSRLGAVYVPLDPHLPSERLHAMLTRLDPPVVMTNVVPSTPASWYEAFERCVVDPSSCMKTEGSDGQPPRRTVNADDIAAILFTSGSTGLPKGVLLTHRNLIDPVVALGRLESMAAGSRIFQFASCSFDVHMIDILGALIHGACICQVSQEKMLDRLSDWIQTMQADTIHLTPTVLATMKPEEVPSLRYVVTCGEPVSAEVVSAWAPRVVLRNLYGMTTYISGRIPLSPNVALANVGQASPHARITILDPISRQPVAAGHPGEIFAAGTSVAAGYWQDPENTARSFFVQQHESQGFTLTPTCQPKAGEPAWYATGDLGYLAVNGDLYLMGRADRQVKVNGQRVELGEIEKVLSPHVGWAVVRARKADGDQTRLFAFVTSSRELSTPDDPLGIDESPVAMALRKSLSTACLEALPAYMVPWILVLDAMPQNRSQKVDHQRLEALLESRLVQEMEKLDHSAPCTDLVSQVASIVSHRLRHTVPVDEDLRNWGLSSMDALFVTREILKTTGKSIRLRDVFHHHTVEQLVQLIESRDEESERTVPSLPHYSAASTRFRAAPGQKSIFNAHQVLGNGAYNCNFIFDLKRPQINLERFFDAVRQICRVHESLRCTYELDDDDDAQVSGVVHPPESLLPVLVYFNFSQLCEMAASSNISAIQSTAQQLIHEVGDACIDVSCTSPLRVSVYEMSADLQDVMIHFRVHHLAIDEWSFEALVQDIFNLYSSGEPSSLLRASYRESAAQQTQSMADREADDRSWWAQQADPAWSESWLEGLLTRQGECSEVQSSTAISDGNRSRFHCRPLPTSEVERFLSSCGKSSTRFDCWLSVCQVFLARIAQRSQFLLGIPTSTRLEHPRYQDVMGCCVLAIPLPVRIDCDQSFRSVRDATHDTYWEAVSHVQSIEQVVDWLSVADTDRALTEVVFVYHDRSQAGQVMQAGISASNVSRVDLVTRSGPYPLILYVDESTAQSRVIVEYQQTAFRPDFIASITDSFANMVRRLGTYGPDTVLRDIPLCSDEMEEATMVHSTTAMSLSQRSNLLDHPESCYLDALVFKAIHQHGDAVAIESFNRRLSFAALGHRILILAAELRACGLGPGSTATLFLEKSIEYVVAMIAVLYTGAAFVAMDVHEKPAVNQSKIDVVLPRLVITDAEFEGSARQFRMPSNASFVFDIGLVDFSKQPTEHPEFVEAPNRHPPSAAAACFGFTSGSTGAPKCFQINHHSATASVMSHIGLCGIRPKDRVAMLSNVTFDVSLAEIFVTLGAGASIAVAPHDRFISDLGNLLNAFTVSHVMTTPTLIAHLDGSSQVPSIRCLILCGEPIPLKLLQRWEPQVSILVGCGPSEATINTHGYYITTGSPRPGHKRGSCIGKPIPTVRATVIDEFGHVLPTGWVGRLAIAARVPGKVDQLSAGYLRPMSANNRFIEHPRLGRMYDSGDVCSIDAEGYFYLRGRVDDQVKINGVRFNLGEAESTVDQSLLPTQGQGVLIVGTHHSGEGAVLVAFVGERESSSEEKSPRVLPLDNQSRIKQLNILRDRVSDALPAAMVPRYWIPISPMPRGVTGKANRPLLKQWFGDLQQTDTAEQYASLVSRECEHPQDRTSSLMDSLRECWATVLPAAAGVSADSSFFKTGGDSITAIRFCSQARHRGVQGCSVRLMMAHPTLAGLTRVLTPLQMETKGEESRIATATVTKESSVEQAREDPMDWLRRHYPGYNESMPKRLLDAVNAQCHDQESNAVDKIYSPSAMQQTMLAQSLIDPELYATQLLLRFTGPLDVARLQDAWTSVCQAHPSLRTCYISLSNGPLEFFAVERRSASSTTHFWVTERVPLTDDELEKELLTIRKSALSIYQRTSALTIFSLATEEHLAVLTCHHAVVDGWSLKQLLSDFANAYQNQQPLDPGHSFSIFSAALQSRDNSKAVEFWSQYVAGGQSASLVQDGGCQAVSGQRRSCQLEHRLSCSTAQALRDAAMQHGTTPAILFQAALGVSLARLTGTTTPLFWVTSNGRDPDIPDALSTIGNFINAVPCLVPTSKNCSVRRLLHYLHRISGQAASHSWLPASSILPSLPDDSQVIDTILILENHDQHGRVEFGQGLYLECIGGREVSNVPLSVIACPDDSEISVTVKYDASQVASGRASGVLETMTHVVENMVSCNGPDLAIENLIRDGTYFEQRHVLQQVQALDRMPEQDTLVSLFAASAQANAKSTALVTPGASMTYGQLDQLSSRLAIDLLQFTHGRQVIVPILFAPKPTMIIAMLSVIKAGAAYCPLDMGAPPSRLEYMMNAVNASVLLTDDDGYPLLSPQSRASIQAINLDGLQWTLCDGREVDLPKVSSDSPCYVLFTSGSTGQPKGCILSHGAVASSVKSAVPIFQLEKTDRVLLFANYVFDASVVDIYGSLAQGAALCLLPDEQTKTDMCQTIYDHRISFVHLTPTMIQFLDLDRCPSLRTVVSGGEMIPEALRNRLAGRVRFVANYGLTETAVQVATSVTTESPCTKGTYYRPLAGNVVAVMNPRGEVARRGEPGEVYIVCVSSLDKMLFYRSGDWAQYTDDMEIQLLGRGDNQMKYLGQRLDPVEVETVLNDAPGVAISAVVLVNSCLCAGLERQPGKPLDLDTVRSYAQARLPERMMPVLSELSQVRLLRSKKLDRAAVAREISCMTKHASNPPGTTGQSRSIQLAVQSDVQSSALSAAVSSMVSRILSISIADIHRPLIHLGLNSLGFVQLRQMIHTELGVPLSYSSLRAAATIEGICHLLPESGPTRIASAPETSREEVVKPVIRPGRYPAIPSQESMWMAQAKRRDATYVVQRVWEVQRTSSSQLVNAILALVREFEVFHLTFEFDGNEEQFHQVLHSHAQTSVGVHFLEHGATPQLDLPDLDLRTGPLSAFQVYERADGVIYLHTAIHHILVDEFTSGVLNNALEAMLKDAPVPDGFGSTTQLPKDSTVPHPSEAQTLWANRLAGLSAFPGSQHISPSSIRSEKAQPYRRIRKNIDMPLHQQTMACLGSHILREQPTLLALFQATLHRVFKNREVALTVPVSMRDRPGKPYLTALGNLTDMVIIRSRLINDDSWSKLLDRCAQEIQFTKANAVPANWICSWLKVELADFPVQFIVHQTGTTGHHSLLQDCTFDLIGPKQASSGCMVHVFVSETGFEILVDHNPLVLTTDSVNDVVNAFADLLETFQQHLSLDLHEFTGLPLFTASREGSSDSSSVITSAASVAALSSCQSVDSHCSQDGTLDNDPLPEPKPDSDQAGPRDILQTLLCQILDVDSLHPDQNLREIGLDSFQSLVLIWRLQKSIPGSSLDLQAITEYPTLSGLSEYLFGVKAVTEKRAPASSMQRRFYLLQEIFGDATYSLPCSHELVDLSLDRVMRQLEVIVQSEAVFWSRFTYEQTLWQVASDMPPLAFVTHRFDDEAESTAWNRMSQICVDDFQEPFDLSSPPLIRCHGFHLPGNKQYLYINMHHAISDEGSLSLLLTELETGQIRTQKEPSYAYQDFSISEARTLADKTYIAASRAHWKSALGLESSISPMLPLGPTSSTSSVGVVGQKFNIPEKAAAYAQPVGGTSFGTLLSLFMITVLLEYGCKSPAVLIPVSSRPIDSNKPIYGCFTNTLPIRPVLDPESPVLENTKQVLRGLNGALKYSQTPFEDILESLDLDAKVFEIMFVYHERSSELGRFRPVTSRVLGKVKSVTAKFPLTFSVTLLRDQSPLELDVTVDFDARMLAHHDAQRLVDSFRRTLLALSDMEDPASMVTASLNLPLSGELQTLESFHGPRDPEVNTIPLIHEQIRQMGSRVPQRTAIVFEGATSSTYEELLTRVSTLVEWLQQHHGLPSEPDATVCIFSDACIDRIVCILAILQLGLAYVPLNITNPVDRNMTIIRDCKPLAILAPAAGILEHDREVQNLRSQLAEEMHGCAQLVVVPETLRDITDSPSIANNAIARPDPSVLAYVLYTSGSTGVPKGVAVDHQALRSSVKQHRCIYHLQDTSRLLQLAPYTFDVSVVDIFATLSAGATLVIGRQDFLLSRLQQAVADWQVTHIATTPTVASLLSPSLSPSIQVLALGGEPMTEPVRDTWARETNLLNVYGPTETTVNVISRQMNPDTAVSCIGRPLPNVLVYILDDEYRRLAPGMTGQLAIGGVQVARGYLRPQSAKPAFITHGQLGRLYLTGDLAKFSVTGEIIFLGRLDTQVKLRGQRIEIGEIEAVLSKENQALVNATFLRKDQHGDTLVTAFVPVTKGDEHKDRIAGRLSLLGQDGKYEYRDAILSMHAAVQSKLPPYSCPTYWLPVHTFPWTQSNKLDRKALGQWIQELDFSLLQSWNIAHLRNPSQRMDSTSHHEHGDLLTSTEAIVARAFTKVLQIPNIGRSSDFFIKGDSISAVRVCTAIRQSGYEIRVSDIYKHSVVADLATFLDAPKKSRSRRRNKPKLSLSSQTTIQTTPVIDWFLRARKNNIHWFNQSHVIRSKGPSWTLDHLVRAWTRLVIIHPSLRIRYTPDKSRENCLSLADPTSNDIRTVSKQATSLADVSKLADELQGQLNICHGPITAIGEYHVQADKYYVIAVHHMAIDVVSWSIVFDELEQLLQGQDIAPEPVSFQQWSDELRGRRDSLPASTHELPSDANKHLLGYTENNCVENTIGNSQYVHLKEHGLVDHIMQLSNHLDHVGPVDVLLSALLIAFCHWKGAAPVEISFESHGRDLTSDQTDWSRTLGWFTYIIPMQFDIDPSQPPVDIIRIVRETRARCLDQADFARPFPSSLSNTRMIAFNYLGASSRGSTSQTFEHVSLSSGSVEDPKNARLSALDVECSITDGVLDLGIIFSKAVFDTASMEQLLELWTQALQQLISRNPGPSMNTLQSPLTTPVAGLTRNESLQLTKDSLRPHNVDFSTVADIIPATDTQAAMLLAGLQSNAYMNYCEYEVEEASGNFALSKMIEAWTNVLSQHSIFRTVFVPGSHPQSRYNNGVLQVVLHADQLGPVISQRPHKSVKLDYGVLPWALSIYQSTESKKYVIQWTCHHALIDGWSTGVLLRQVRQFYETRRVEVPTAQFADISRHFANTDISDSIRFLRNQLEGVTPTLLTCMTSENNAGRNTLGLRALEKRLSVNWDDLRKVAAGYCAPISVFFRAAWSLVLSRYTTRDDVVFGCVIHYRGLDYRGIQEIIGPCINAIPFRVQIDWAESLQDFLERVAEEAADIFEHDSLSLHRIQKAAGVTNLFNTTLLVQDYPRDTRSSSSPYKLHRRTLQEPTDVAFQLMVEPTSIGTVRVGVDTTLEQLPNDFLDRILTSFARSLEYLAAADQWSGTSLKELDLLGPEHLLAIDRFGSGDKYAFDELTIWEHLESQMRKTPDNTAIEFWSPDSLHDSISYHQLRQRAEDGAHNLAAAGVNRGSLVAVYMDRSINAIVTLFAIFRLDCYYVPIDLGSPPDRINMLLDEAQPRAVRRVDGGQLELPKVQASLDDPATILFTSGSTGQPKGVSMPHRQVAGYAMTMIEAYAYTETERIFNFARFVFDVSLSDIYGALFCGATLCIARQLDVFSFLPSILDHAQITALNVTPSVASLLDVEGLSSLRHLVITGEMARSSLVEQWAGRCRLVNSYGPTEAAVITWTVAEADMDARCIGSAVRGMSIYILDDHMQHVPLGAQGTIWCTGRQLSLGYLGRPEATAKAFQRNPFGAGVLYKTGDLGAYDRTGRIICFGRADNQVKIHGQRVELGEIDHQLSNNGVDVVTLLCDNPSPPKLVAFVSTAGHTQGAAVSSGRPCVLDGPESRKMVSDLQNQARQKLPQYMVPSVFIPISCLPLSNNGKVVRPTLQSLYLTLNSSRHPESSTSETIGQHHRSKAEAHIYSILRSHGYDSLAKDAGLFPGCMDSFTVILFLIQLRRDFGITSLSLEFIIQNNTFRQLAEALQKASQPSRDDYDRPASDPEPNSGLLRFSTPSGADRPKLFAIFGVHGLSVIFSKLAAHLPLLDICGIEKIQFGRPEKYQSIPDMAQDHLSILRHAQPHGPYYICGYSFGGCVALEMGHQLRLEDEEVRLIIIDSHANYRPKFPAQISDEDCEKVFNIPTLTSCRTADAINIRECMVKELNYNLVLHTNYLVTRRYEGRVLFIKASGEMEKTGGDMFNGFKELMPEIRVVMADGIHRDLLSKQQSVKQIAHAVETFIQE
ncbi:hypothetical protein AWENTII_008895 [Aspergillus wentii]